MIGSVNDHTKGWYLLLPFLQDDIHFSVVVVLVWLNSEFDLKIQGL